MTQWVNERSKKNEEFGRLLSGAINSIATYEGKTAPAVEEELGQHIGLSGASIQRYKRGHLPPDARTVHALAEAAVKRGFLNRRWLSKFLRVSAYPSPDALLDDLCPVTTSDVGSDRVMHNLPPPSYAQFVMRAQPFSDVLEALQQRTAAVVISSLGGMGKTSLAREVAARCVDEAAPDAGPHFDSAVWVSDAERPGFTTLNTVLDEIARTLHMESVLERGEEEKRREVEYLLRSRRVLVVVDNFETISDVSLLRWLLKLPEPSKALITTREYRREFRQGAWPVELRGMQTQEAQEFVQQRLRMLRMDQLVNSPQQFAPLLEVTGGNPKAIELALGSLKYSRRPVLDVADDLRSARGDLFNDLFQRNWSMLDEAARRLLLAATLFAPSADAGALAVTADVRPAVSFASLERLTDLSLLDVLQESFDRKPRYSLHPLMRAFAQAELASDPAFEQAARERWLDWYVQLASQVGYSRNDLRPLELLDPEREMLHVVLAWAKWHGRHDKVLALASGAGFYCYLRGLMYRVPDMNWSAAEAARAQHNPVEEMRWTAFHVQRLARAGRLAEAQHALPRMHELARTGTLPIEAMEPYHHAQATLHLAAGHLADAEREWRALLETPQLSPSSRLVTAKWLAICLRQNEQTTDARDLLRAALQADDQANLRARVALQLLLARILLDEGDLAEATALANEIRATITQGKIDRHLPDLRMLEGDLARLTGDQDAARAAFVEAAETFERIGLRRELHEAHAAIDDLSARPLTE